MVISSATAGVPEAVGSRLLSLESQLNSGLLQDVVDDKLNGQLEAVHLFF
jgi:hypothetical protein